MTAPQNRAHLGVLLAGGGSGGHIYPNIAILERLREHEPHLRAEFLVSARPIDASILTDEGLPFTTLSANPLALDLRALLRLLRTWGRAVREARARIRAMRDACERVVVVATGGFVSAPVANAARAEGVPFLLVNLDARPGKANRWAARLASRRLTAADGDAPPAWDRIRPIVRDRAVGADKDASRRLLGLRPDAPTLLVTGASQGARSINEFMCAFVRDHAGALAGWQVVHQTGSAADVSIPTVYQQAGVRAHVLPFITEIGAAWGAADLAVSRSGAGSVAEAWANRTPTLFLPYPHHRDEHQRLNAAPVVDAGAAALCVDHIDPARNLEDAGEILRSLLGDRARREAMRAAFDRLGPADGAEAAARAVLGLCRD